MQLAVPRQHMKKTICIYLQGFHVTSTHYGFNATAMIFLKTRGIIILTFANYCILQISQISFSHMSASFICPGHVDLLKGSPWYNIQSQLQLLTRTNFTPYFKAVQEVAFRQHILHYFPLPFP